ncbi:LIM-domain binding protein/SEUSS [Sesbania bispinosa]|nr:LIM-domain binding protein/SEUSS [Sesbania bispinosa]
MGAHVAGSFIQDPNIHLAKKPRLDIKQDDIMQQQRPHDSGVGGVCSRRLMQYLYHQRQRPPVSSVCLLYVIICLMIPLALTAVMIYDLCDVDNSIGYWRKFVAEYYSPRAKQRWCLSLYSNVGQHAFGVFPQVAMGAWQCDICGSKSGKGFEATFDVLPRLNEIKFGSGLIDELLFLDMPREIRSPSGAMMLEYTKAVQECVYEQLRVVREGQLRIIFTQDLKIFSWEFCARRHEELLPRKLVAPQVNQLVQVAQKCQSTIAESGSDGVSQQDLQTNSNMVLTAGRQLAKSLELQSLNDLGFSKRYVRCLQISEVCNSMKDLIDTCYDRKIGAIESLKEFPRVTAEAKLQMQKMPEMEQLANVQGLPTDRNTLNKLMAMNPAMNNHINNNHNNMVNRGGSLGGSAQAAMALTNYQSLVRQNSTNSSPGSLQRERPSFSNTNQSPSSAVQGAGSQGNQALDQQMIQQILQMSNNNGGVQPQSLGGPNANGNMAKSGLGFGSQTPAISGGSANVPGNNRPVSRSNSFKAASNSDSSAAGGNNGFNQRTSDMSQNLHLQDVVHNIAPEFTDNHFFNSDLDDNMGFDWKA